MAIKGLVRSWHIFIRRAPHQRLQFSLLLAAVLLVVAVDLANRVISPQLHWVIDVSIAVATLSLVAGLVVTAARVARTEAAQEKAAAVEAERRVMSRELHDSVAQQLCYLHMRLDQLSQLHHAELPPTLRRELADLRVVASDAYDEVYRLLSSLRVSAVGDLTDAVKASAATAAERAGFATSVRVQGIPRNLGPRATEQVVQIVNEALTNAAKHAGARKVAIDIGWSDEQLQVAVADDGCGFDPAEVESCGHFGLRIMTERAEMIRGRIDYRTKPGGGTIVLLSVPLDLTQPSS